MGRCTVTQPTHEGASAISHGPKSGGALSALGQAPRPPMEPFIPLGSEGELRGRRVIMIGFVIRGTWVEGRFRDLGVWIVDHKTPKS